MDLVEVLITALVVLILRELSAWWFHSFWHSPRNTDSTSTAEKQTSHVAPQDACVGGSEPSEDQQETDHKRPEEEDEAELDEAPLDVQQEPLAIMELKPALGTKIAVLRSDNGSLLCLEIKDQRLPLRPWIRKRTALVRALMLLWAPHADIFECY